MLDELLEIERVADGVRSDGITDVVLLGMGGSSLAPEVFRRTFRIRCPPPGPAHPGLRLHVLDSTDPAWISAVQEAVDPARTLFVVSSKSGGTIEPLSLFAHFHALQPDGSHFVAITDPGSGLAELATRERLPPRLLRRPRHRRALQRALAVRDRARHADGRRHGRAAAPRRSSPGRRARPAPASSPEPCGWARCSPRSRAPGATS